MALAGLPGVDAGGGFNSVDQLKGIAYGVEPAQSKVSATASWRAVENIHGISVGECIDPGVKDRSIGDVGIHCVEEKHWVAMRL
eukprot:11992655-Karenia_brevis.AAC.1